MEVDKEWLQSYKEQDIYRISLYNDNGLTVNIINYGATIENILVPDSKKRPENIVLSYNTIEEYFNDPHYLGCTVGRYANRISGGLLKINNTTYQLSQNEAGKNHLHGGYNGFNKKIWHVDRTFKESGKAGVVLSLVSPDLEEGYPGNMSVEVTYTLSNLNELSIAYNASTDRPTVVNLTNHTYFNLSGGKSDISSYLLNINATEFTPTDNSYIPRGSIEPVENSIFDLRKPKHVGEFMHQIITANYCLNNHKEFEFAARLSDPESGKSLEIRTTNPGLQLYCGNYLSGIFKPFSGICLEPHFYPDSPNHPQFPSTLLLPGEVYNEITSYKFC